MNRRFCSPFSIQLVERQHRRRRRRQRRRHLRRRHPLLQQHDPLVRSLWPFQRRHHFQLSISHHSIRLHRAVQINQWPVQE